MPLVIATGAPQGMPADLAAIAEEQDALIGEEMADLVPRPDRPYSAKVYSALTDAIAKAAKVMGLDLTPEKYTEDVAQMDGDVARFLAMMAAAASDYGKPFPVELEDIKGDAELTYSQYFPNAELFRYDEQEYASALARWAAGGVGSPLPTNEEFFGTSAGSPSPDSLVGRFGPTNASQASAVATAYLQNAGACTARHPVTEGLAGSPFFIEPEVQVRVAKNLTVSLYGRLQVVSGSRVFRDDPTKPLFEGSDATQNDRPGQNTIPRPQSDPIATPPRPGTWDIPSPSKKRK